MLITDSATIMLITDLANPAVSTKK